MADALGTLAKMGLKIGLANWAAGWTTADELIPFDSAGDTQVFNRIDDEALLGSAGMQPSDQGVQVLAFPTNHTLDYNNFDALFELFFGAVAGRVFTFSNDTVLKYCGIELEKQVSRWRYFPGKLTKLVISGEKDQAVKVVGDWVFRDIDRNATAFPALSLTGARNKVRFEDMQFRLADLGDAIAAGDILKIESFELELDRVLVTDDYTTKDATAGSEKWPEEPIPNGFIAASLKFKLPRYASDADVIAFKEADTTLQTDLTFTRSGETLVIELPHGKVLDGFDAQIGGPERVQNEGTLKLYRPASTNPMYTGGQARITFT